MVKTFFFFFFFLSDLFPAHEFFMLLVAKLDAEALTAPAGKKKKKKKNKSAGFSEVSKSGAPIVVKTLGVAEEKGPLTLLFELVVTNKKQNKRVMEPCLGLSVPLSDNWPSQVKLLAIEQLAPVVCVHLVRESDDYGTRKLEIEMENGCFFFFFFRSHLLQS